MLWLLIWMMYGLIVGLLSKALHRGPDPTGFFQTIAIGIAGSFIGGFFNFLLGKGDPFQTSGILMGVIGGVIFCFIYQRFKLGQYLEMQKLEEEIKALKADDEE